MAEDEVGDADVDIDYDQNKDDDNEMLMLIMMKRKMKTMKMLMLIMMNLQEKKLTKYDLISKATLNNILLLRKMIIMQMKF